MTLINNTSQLQDACNTLKNEDFITVDTEFLRDKLYYPKLCLIQIASQHNTYVIDPINTNINLSSLFDLFQDPKVTKVFHSARQDIEIIFNLSNTIPTPLFDTQVAAMVCGFGEAVSYAKLVQDITNHTLNKSMRFTDWSKRPLSEEQLHYALCDVTYLRDIYTTLKTRLQETNREQWVHEEMVQLTNKNNYIIDPSRAWEKIKSRGASKHILGTLKELATWREIKAQTLNQPRTHILKDQALLELASVAPTTKKRISNMRWLGNIKSEYLTELLQIINHSLNTPENNLPQNHNESHTKPNSATIEILRLLLKAKCNEYDVAEKLVATTDDLKQIALGNNQDLLLYHGWRNEVFGQHVHKLLNAQIGLSLSNNKVCIVELE